MKIAKSRLRLGTKTVIAEARPPKGCLEVSKCLPDPSFETQVSTWDGGPNGNEIPQGFDDNDASILLRWPSDDSSGPNDTYYFQDHAFEEVDSWRSATYWIRSTADPRTGTYHLSAEYGNDPEDFNTRSLWVANIKLCNPPDPLLGMRWATAFLSEGQDIDLSIYARHTAAVTGVFGAWFVVYLDEAGEYISNQAQVAAAIGSSYAEIATSFTAPASTAYVSAAFTTTIETGSEPSGNTVVYIDDVGVTSPGCA